MKNLVQDVRKGVRMTVSNMTDKDYRILMILGLTLILSSLIPIEVFVGAGIFLMGFGLKIKKTLEKLDTEGFINKKSEQMREVLLERSLYDIFADLWYFPKITLYLKALLGPLITQEAPDLTIHNFDNLAPGFKKLMLTKGLINILPLSLRSHLLPAENVQKVLSNDPARVSEVDPSMQQMIQKVLNPEQQTKYYKYEVWQQRKNQLEQNATFETNKLGFLKKFLQGSKNVTPQEKKKILTLSLIAGIAFLVLIKRSPKSRTLLKKIILTLIFLSTFSTFSGGLILVLKHQKAQKLKNNSIK